MKVKFFTTQEATAFNLALSRTTMLSAIIVNMTLKCVKMYAHCDRSLIGTETVRIFTLDAVVPFKTKLYINQNETWARVPR